MVIWVGLNHLPVTNAALLDHSITRSFGEDSLPHFGSVFENRNTIVGLVFVTAFALSISRARMGDVPGRYYSPLATLVFAATGYLAWITGAGLSSLGHGFVLGGAVAAAGMYSIALTHLAAYGANSSNRIVADLAGWLALRVFVLGMNVAFYGLLLRPVLYEYLWLAPLYEYACTTPSSCWSSSCEF